MKHMKQIKRSEVFTRFFFSYLIILLIPFLVFSVLIVSIMMEIKKNSVRESEYVLNSICDTIDHKMELVYSDALNLNYNITLNSILHAPPEEKDIGKLLAFREDLNYLEEDGDVIYIYLPEEDALISSKGVYSKMEKVYGTVFSYADMDYQTFHDEVLNGDYSKKYLPDAQVKANSRSRTAILYMEKLPFGTKKNNSATALFFINSEQIHQKMQSYVEDSDYWFHIYTREKELIFHSDNYSSDTEKFVDEFYDPERHSFTAEGGYEFQNSIYTMAKSESNGWLFVSGVEKKDLFRQVKRIQMIVFTLFFIYAVLGCYVAYYITRRNMRPVYRLLEQWNIADQREGEWTNEFQLLESYFQDVIRQNQQLTISNSGYLDKMKEIWIQNLICGKYNTMQEVSEIEIPEITGHQHYQVLAIDFSASVTQMENRTIDDFNAQRYLLKKLIQRYELEDSIMTEVNVYRLGILFYSDEPLEVFEAKMEEAGKQLLAYLSRFISDPVRIGQGETVENVLRIGYSFIQAECAIRACREYNRTYISYKDIPRQNEKYYFPDQLREMLFGAIQDGNLKQANSILKVLNVENFENRKLSKKQISQFLEEMYSVLLHLKNKDLYLEDTIEPEQELNGQDKYYYYVQKILTVCNQKTEQEFSRKKQMQQDLLAFIDSEYSNSNLCLSMVATHFQLSESYISYLFKKNYGVTFSNYLEHKRIEEAKVLLLEGKYSIEETGRKVGYNSSHVFRRAFRKITGKNPSDLMKKQNL